MLIRYQPTAYNAYINPTHTKQAPLADQRVPPPASTLRFRIHFLHQVVTSVCFTMDDPELARWRAQRMNQMRGGLPGGGPSGQSAEQIEQQRKKQEYVQLILFSTYVSC